MTFRKLLQSEKLTFRLGVFLVFLLVAISCVGLFILYLNTRPKTEPELTVHAKNSFKKTLRVVGDVDYKPFSYVLEDGKPRGYDIELVTELANRIEYNLELELMNWDQAVEKLKENKADLIIGADWQDSNIMDCEFTVPSFEESFTVFQEAPIKLFSDLYNKKIAVIENCGMKDTLKKYHLWQNCEEYKTITDCVSAVIAKKCDCFIAHHTIGEVGLQKFGALGKHFRGRLNFAPGQMCFGIAKDNPVLFARINTILLEMRSDGTADSLCHKWVENFDHNITLHEYIQKNPKMFFLIVDSAIAGLLIIIVMYYYLIRIRKERNRAIEAEHAKSLFFSIVSHDIRTPLNAIIGFSELLKNGISNENERKSALDVIISSGHTLLELVNDVLNISKLETNKMSIVTQLTDMTKLVSSILHSFDIMVTSDTVKLVGDMAPMPCLYVDPDRIRQILNNLLSNALKFTEHGEIRLKGSFEPLEGQDEGTGTLTLSVSDTGCGITPENQKKLMRPFIQIQTKQALNGTGLGLYICKQLSMRMGGDLTLESEFGKGTTFTLTLRNVRFSSKQLEIVEKTHIENRNDFHNIRILIVDDIPVNCRVLETMLRRLDVTNITTAGNGVEAMKQLYSTPDGFDIVLTDMWMPEMDGEALIHEIRKKERWKTLPVFAVTADIEAQNTYSNSGFTGLLLKPINLEKLRAILSQRNLH
ncbi:MAG: transporter substrate-binding domain-containing protein [Victivallales bacterium]|nr:transporter substrate-binding domain-containing protein [Victivallales bacterium]